MPALNSSHTSFLLRGFPLLQGAQRRLLALPFSASYLAVLLGNSALVFVVWRAKRLRSPMNLLICWLCLVDVLAASAIVPSLLLSLLLDLDRVSLTFCLLQMFSTHFLSSLESTLLLAMALDRYVAVCLPLRYGRLVGAPALAALLLFTLLRSGSALGLLVALAGSLHFCGSDVIRHCYCDHMALVSLACGSTASSTAVGLAVIACVVGVDIPLIAFSYARILVAVRRAAAAGQDPRKALHTCGTHMITMLCFYLVGSVAFLSHNLHIPMTPDLNSVLGVTYILLPATANPVIYGVRTREIRRGLLALLRLRATGGSQVLPARKVFQPSGKE